MLAQLRQPITATGDVPRENELAKERGRPYEHNGKTLLSIAHAATEGGCLACVAPRVQVNGVPCD